jgi:hypothetical protein
MIEGNQISNLSLVILYYIRIDNVRSRNKEMSYLIFKEMWINLEFSKLNKNKKQLNFK